MEAVQTAKEISRLFLSALKIKSGSTCLGQGSEKEQVQGIIYLYLGIISYKKGDYSQAEELFNQSACSFASCPNHLGEAFAMYGLGLVHLARNEREEASSAFRESYNCLSSWAQNHALVANSKVLYRFLTNKLENFILALSGLGPLPLVQIFGESVAGKPVYTSPYLSDIIQTEEIIIDNIYEYKLLAIEESKSGPPFPLKPEEVYFIWRVSGDSMSEVGLKDGSLVLVRLPEQKLQEAIKGCKTLKERLQSAQNWARQHFQDKFVVVQIYRETVVRKVCLKSSSRWGKCLQLRPENTNYVMQTFTFKALLGESPALQFLGIVLAKLEPI